MKISMQMYRRKNGYYYVRYYRGKEQSLNTKEKDLAVELYRGLKEDFLKGKLLHLQNDKKITLGD